MPVAGPEHAWAAHLPGPAPGGERELLTDGSLPGRWLRRWSEHPGASQLVGPDGRSLSTGGLEELSRGAARRLRAAGLQPGDRFVVSAASSVAFVITYVAALRAGLVVVPLNTAYTRVEVQRIVKAACPAAAAVDDDERGRWIRDASGDRLQIMGIELEPGPPSADDAIDASVSEDPALLVYTSGTTGQPKGALLSHANLLSSATAVNLAWRWVPEDRLLLTLPLFHLHGLGVGINGSLCAGASIWLRPRFEAAEVAHSCRQGTTLFFGVPAMYQRLAAGGQLGALSPLRLLVSGSAPLPATLAEEIAAQLGQIPLERYGMTETVMLTSNPYEGPRKPGTVGLPLPGVEVRLAASGEVEVRGPNVIRGYHQNPSANRDAFTRDGWFRTGDLGSFDDDGFLRLVGRSKELIITGGYNVHPREVEEALATHPQVEEVAVVGRASEVWGEEVTAVVVARAPVDAEALRAHAARQLAPYKIPKRVEFITELPRNALGKVLRKEL
jgi:malonyl-CoA/methylmalonyl-CoA synthetase